MNVIAATCEHCLGTRIILTDIPGKEAVRCWVCTDGYERPPVNHDLNARRDVEGETEHE